MTLSSPTPSISSMLQWPPGKTQRQLELTLSYLRYQNVVTTANSQTQHTSFIYNPMFILLRFFFLPIPSRKHLSLFPTVPLKCEIWAIQHEYIVYFSCSCHFLLEHIWHGEAVIKNVHMEHHFPIWPSLNPI